MEQSKELKRDKKFSWRSYLMWCAFALLVMSRGQYAVPEIALPTNIPNSFPVLYGKISIIFVVILMLGLTDGKRGFGGIWGILTGTVVGVGFYFLLTAQTSLMITLPIVMICFYLAGYVHGFSRRGIHFQG